MSLVKERKGGRASVSHITKSRAFFYSSPCMRYRKHVSFFPTLMHSTNQAILQQTPAGCPTTWFHSDTVYPGLVSNHRFRAQSYRTTFFHMSITSLSLWNFSPYIGVVQPPFKVQLISHSSLAFRTQGNTCVYPLIIMILMNSQKKRCTRQGMRSGAQSLPAFSGCTTFQDLHMLCYPEAHQTQVLGGLWRFHYVGMIDSIIGRWWSIQPSAPLPRIWRTSQSSVHALTFPVTSPILMLSRPSMPPHQLSQHVRNTHHSRGSKGFKKLYQEMEDID